MCGICSLQMGNEEKKPKNTYSLFSVYKGHIFYKGVIYGSLLGAAKIIRRVSAATEDYRLQKTNRFV